MTRRTALSIPRSRRSMLHARWWESASSNDKDPDTTSLITPQMEREVMSSARATMDTNTVNRALTSLIDESDSNGNLRDLVTRRRGAVSSQTASRVESSRDDQQGNNVWTAQQVALASGVSVLVLSPVIVPVVHSFLPPIIPFPSSISFEGAALLGALSYIVALGDPAKQSSSGVLGESVEIGGAASRIVGRTALASVQTSAPRIKAAARALVDYDEAAATLEEMNQLSQTVRELETENQELKREINLWQAVEDVSSMYKLEELKELARYKGVKGYSTESKNALLRKLIRLGVVEMEI